MTIEATLYTLIAPLFDDEFYPDVAPLGTPRPYGTYQQVGGESIGFLDNTGVASKKNGRFQFNVWAATRLEAATLARQLEDLIVSTASLQATAIGAPTAIHEPETNLYGTRQDFSLWF